ncbi:transferase [Escherichia coli]|nr:transferase [Escherichia coli]
MGRWWRYKWITFHPSLTIDSLVCFQTITIQNTGSWSG